MPVFFRDRAALYHSSEGPAPKTTSHMVESFLFSKPSFTLQPFVPWGCCEDDVKRRVTRHVATPPPPPAEAALSCSWHDASVRPVFLQQPLADTCHIAPRREVQDDDDNEAVYESLVRQKALRSVVWKRRSFVDKLSGVPEQYQHRSVVPNGGTSGSPRRLMSAPATTHQQSRTSPASSHAPQPSGGIFPVVGTRKPKSWVPVTTSSSALSNAFFDQAAANRMQRTILESRVQHVVTAPVSVSLHRRRSSHKTSRTDQSKKAPESNEKVDPQRSDEPLWSHSTALYNEP